MTSLSLDTFRTARDRIRERVHLTPVLGSTMLGELAHVTLTLKCECFQKTGSFKVRGALNKLNQLSDAERARGVISVSAGNHAQALAWAARAAGVACTVVMPAAATMAKVVASRGYGAQVILHGKSADAFVRARELADERGMTFVHPFDDEEIIAGAGSVGLEIIEQVADADVIVVPIGGGGLIAGVAAAVRQAKPGVRVFGVEPTGADAMRKSLDAGHLVTLDGVNTIADGLAPPFAGVITFDLVRKYVDDVVLVSDSEIANAMAMLLERTKILAEPAGAATTAALLSGRIPSVRGSRVVSIVSGGNVDLGRLAQLLGEREGAAS